VSNDNVNKIALTNCRLIDGLGGTPLSDAAIVIDGGRFTDVGVRSSVSVPTDAMVFDLAGQTVLPGLIDLHVHLTFYYQRAQASDYDDSRVALLGAWHMGKLLDAGITSVRDVGSCGHIVFDLKWAGGEGLVRGPRIWAAGRIIVPTGGHVTRHRGMSLEFDGAVGARSSVRREVKAGADFIKIACLKDEWTLDELEAAVDQAHRLGRRVACHVNYPPSITNALNAGVDSIEHGCLINEEELQKMADQGTFLILTPLIYRIQFEKFKGLAVEQTTPPDVALLARDQVRRHEWIWDNMPGAILRAAELGVKIGVGSDQLYPEYGIATLPQDMALLVEIGLPPMLVIQGATSRAAECIGVKDDLGTVETGKLADLIVVDSDPLSDMNALKNVSCVFKGGAIEKNLLDRSPD
jgi:imidazolonepropionase-like amidohydrolase